MVSKKKKKQWYQSTSFLWDDPCSGIVGGLLLAKKVRFVKSPVVGDIDFKRGWIVMTPYKSYIAKLRLRFVGL